MSNLNISDLPFLDNLEQTDERAFKATGATKIKGGLNLIKGVEGTSQKVANRLNSLGLTSFAKEAAKGPSRFKARLSGLF